MPWQGLGRGQQLQASRPTFYFLQIIAEEKTTAPKSGHLCQKPVIPNIE